MEQKLNNLNDFLLGDLKAAPERLKGEREERLSNGKRTLPFGVSYLDAVAGGISPNDMILMGGRSGAGKTQLATLIALSNAEQGRRVHYFALEAEPREIERRIKYVLINRHISDWKRTDLYGRMNMLDWYMGRLDKDTQGIEEIVDEEIKNRFSTLFTYYRGKDFTVENFEKLFYAVQDKTDLVIVDHLHYFDFDDENENAAQKRIVKKIRDLALVIGKPVLLLAQLRKQVGNNVSLVPDQEEFHGSSDIFKIATKVITIAPAFDQKVRNPREMLTYMRVPKCRLEGSRIRYTAQLCYNRTLNCYEPKFSIGQLIKGGKEFQPIENLDDLPEWVDRNLVITKIQPKKEEVSHAETN